MPSLVAHLASLLATDVDVLQMDVVAPMKIREEESCQASTPHLRGNNQQGSVSRRASRSSTLLDASDLKNYEYESECAFPGSLTSRKSVRLGSEL